MTAGQHTLLRFSLVFVWLATALVSVWELNGQSSAVLHAAGVHDAWLVRSLVWSGAGLDALLGLALWLYPLHRTYLAALAAMLLMTLLASVLDPSLWLHPLGPLTKNIPMAAALWILAKTPP
ncbi:MAG: DoxX-like family protein [Rhodoferax sp.]|nr:DoxX-like family protein [Rhodoferax sp.]MDP3653905.1 DoxX-like family protein [Rhodoferax sp.]